jgi:hypothetical protein
MFVGEVSARLGVDSSGIASDMAKANAAFSQGASAAGDSAGSQFGDKFGSRLKERLLGRAAFSGLFVGIGLDPKGIADTIAGAIVGGTAKGWEEALSASDKFEAALKEKFKLTSTKGQQEQALRRDISSAQAEADAIKPTNHYFKNVATLFWAAIKSAATGSEFKTVPNQLDAGQLAQQQAALTKRQEAENELIVLQKEDTKAQDEFNQAQIESLAGAQKIKALSKEKLDLETQLRKASAGRAAPLALSEQLEIKKKILELDKQIGEASTKENKSQATPWAYDDNLLKELHSTEGLGRGSSRELKSAIGSQTKSEKPEFERLHETIKKSNEHLGKISKSIAGKFVNQ